MTKLERIKKVVKWLIGIGVASNQAGLGKLLGYSNASAFSKVLNGKVSLPNGFTYKLASLDKRLNEHWISEGWDSMLIDINAIHEQKSDHNCLECIKKDEEIKRLHEQLEECHLKYISLLEQLNDKKAI